jgi:threonine dehydrogenase-like Zn-dependent dehydrogenase
MKAIVMVGPKNSTIKQMDDLEPKEGQILVKIKYVGMCMSEWHPWAEAAKGDRFGHEPIGTVAQIGSGVSGFEVGQRVTGLSSTPCYAEYCLMEAKYAIIVPDSLSDDEAIAEPLGCLINVDEKMRTKRMGDSVAIVGCGYMGLGMVSLMKMQGCKQIVVIDPRSEARENALKFGATEVYTPDEIPEKYKFSNNKSDDYDKIYEYGFDYVIEFSGEEDGLQLAGDMTAVDGTLAVGGYHQGGYRKVDFQQWGFKAINVKNAHQRRLELCAARNLRGIKLVESGMWNYKNTVTHYYAPEDFDKAQQDMVNKPKGYLKAVIDFSKLS